MKKTLAGGRVDKIFKQADTVVRPANQWTKDVHDFLRYMESQGHHFVPTPITLTDSEEIVSYMEGEVYNEPLPIIFFTDELLISAAKLLRDFHSIGADYIGRLTGEEKWMLSSNEQVEVMCHGDFAPYNVTVIAGVANGLFDFDTLHPGSRMEDIAYAIYRWVPFYPEQKMNEGAMLDRLRLFIDTYGLTDSERKQLPEAMVARLQQLTDFMRSEAEKGNLDFKRNIEDGHLDKYLSDLEYIRNMKEQILFAIQRTSGETREEYAGL